MEPLRVVLLASRRAPGLERLLSDPNRGATWELALVVSPERHFDQAALLEEAGIPLVMRPLADHPAWRNLRSREDYDRELAELVEASGANFVLLCGYPYILTPPFLERFPDRVLGIHDADLARREWALHAGPHAVRDAIFSGESETRNSVYLVTANVARGPLFLSSGPYRLAPMALDARERGDAPFLEQYAALHREWMRGDWGPMLVRTIELVAGGTMKVVGDVVWIDGAPGPCRMGEAPASCHEPEAMVARGIPRSCPFIG